MRTAVQVRYYVPTFPRDQPEAPKPRMALSASVCRAEHQQHFLTLDRLVTHL